MPEPPPRKLNGELNPTSGIGATDYTPIKSRPVDYDDAYEKGILPSPNGFSWDLNDENSIPRALGRRKFTRERQLMFLETLQRFGQLRHAAYICGISPSCVLEHRKADPELDAEIAAALDVYHSTIAVILTNQALAGAVDVKYDKEGKVTSKRVTYEQQMRLRLLERADDSYKQIQKQEVSVTGGAVVIPAPIDSVEDWAEIVRRHTGESNGSLTGSAVPALESGDAVSEGRVKRRDRTIDVQGEESTGSESEPTENEE